MIQGPKRVAAQPIVDITSPALPLIHFSLHVVHTAENVPPTLHSSPTLNAQNYPASSLNTMPFTVRGSELELPLDDLIFSPVVLWIDSMRQDKVQEDAVLQGAVSSIVNMAKGAIVRKSKATLANYAGSNMDNIFVGARSVPFHLQGIPSRLIK